MKFRPLHLLLIIAFFFTATSFGQVNRRIGREQYKRPKQAERVDFVERSVNSLTKQLKLDDLQKAIVKNIIEEERIAITSINEEKGITIEQRKERAMAISDRIYKKVLPILSKQQADIYTKMKEDEKF